MPRISLLCGAFPLMLCACGGTVIQDRPSPYAVPVAVGCVSDRPDREPTLAEKTPNWVDLALKASPLVGPMDIAMKAAAAAAHAIELRNYSDDLNAATAACPEVNQ